MAKLFVATLITEVEVSGSEDEDNYRQHLTEELTKGRAGDKDAIHPSSQGPALRRGVGRSKVKKPPFGKENIYTFVGV